MRCGTSTTFAKAVKKNGIFDPKVEDGPEIGSYNIKRDFLST